MPQHTLHTRNFSNVFKKGIDWGNSRSEIAIKVHHLRELKFIQRSALQRTNELTYLTNNNQELSRTTFSSDDDEEVNSDVNKSTNRDRINT